MRRLAKQTRGDGYVSFRDYQTIQSENSLKITWNETGLIKFFSDSFEPIKDEFGGFGFFFKSNQEATAKLKVSCGNEVFEIELIVQNVWSKYGYSFKLNSEEMSSIIIEIVCDEGTVLDVWGLSGGKVLLPDSIISKSPSADDINSTHLSPETYYFEHSKALGLNIDPDESVEIVMSIGETINTKKCSYCNRHLPLNPEVLGSLSFHKHNAKISLHQNECRACKKWRINDDFNPKRTTDQLHESSVITRERKILLKEPQILQEIKKRTGAGLKSQIWEKFDKKCFYCKYDVELNEFQLDHTRPLAYLWPIDEYATCLCAAHNNQKKEKFPVEFYSESQLKELSGITGLSVELLSKKEVNQEQLDIIINDVKTFALEWDSRTFSAISRKIIELQPDVNLFDILKESDENLYTELIKDLEDRPDSVTD
jgi:hypothetical protein